MNTWKMNINLVHHMFMSIFCYGVYNHFSKYIDSSIELKIYFCLLNPTTSGVYKLR